MERRNFILAAGGLIGGPAVVRAASLAALPAQQPALRMAAFHKLLGQQFIAYQGLRGTALDLLEVRPGKAAAHHEQFALLFAGPPGLEAGSYEIDNAAAGRLALHLAPAGTDGRGALYRADFSLLV